MPIKVRVGQQNAVKVVSSISGSTAMTLAGLSDVDFSSLQNGSVLVYNYATSKWQSTLSLTPGVTQNLDINGGSF